MHENQTEAGRFTVKALLVILFLFTGLSGGSKDKAREANKAYREGDFAKAEEGYRAALKEDPQNAKLVFNLGNALAKQHKYEEALEKFDTFKNMVDNPDSKAKALYNMGNIFANQKKWDKALDYYRQSLKMNSGDKEAKYNYELAYKHQKQNKHNQNQGKNNPNKQNKNSKNNKNRNNKNNRQNPNQQNKSGNNNQQPPQNKKQQSQSQNQKMSRQEAEKILNALQDQENDLLKKIRKQTTKSDSKKNAKDW